MPDLNKTIDRSIDILLSCRSNAIDKFSGGRVPNFGCSAIGCVALLSSDDKLCHFYSCGGAGKTLRMRIENCLVIND